MVKEINFFLTEHSQFVGFLSATLSSQPLAHSALGASFPPVLAVLIQQEQLWWLL